MQRVHLPTRGAVVAILLLSLAAGCMENAPETGHEHTPDGGHGGEAHEPEEGPMGGRLLEDGDISLEITMFETGVPPEFRVYARRGGKSIDPSAIQVTMELTRLGGIKDRISFEPEGQFLRSTSSIREPHSFAVRVRAQAGSEVHTWDYESFEGRTSIAPEIARQAGVDTALRKKF